jgi:hypothetical protein
MAKRKKPAGRSNKAVRKRIGSMLKGFRAQVFRSREDRARKSRLKPGEDAREGW